jgi:uncharacterized membrane protein YqaE (UPF0057 family)
MAWLYTNARLCTSVQPVPVTLLTVFFSISKQMEFCICLVLTILGYVPGIIYAIYVLVALDSHKRDRDYYEVA